MKQQTTSTNNTEDKGFDKERELHTPGELKIKDGELIIEVPKLQSLDTGYISLFKCYSNAEGMAWDAQKYNPEIKDLIEENLEKYPDFENRVLHSKRIQANLERAAIAWNEYDKLKEDNDRMLMALKSASKYIQYKERGNGLGEGFIHPLNEIEQAIQSASK